MKENKSLRNWYILFSIFLLIACFIRPLNYDEAYYTQSSQKILYGSIPYVDFLFHQPPLLILTYLPVSDFGYYSLIAGRILSALLLVFSLYIFILILKDKGYILIEIKFFFILFALNLFFIDWCVIVKAYSLSVFLTAIIVLCFTRRDSAGFTLLLGLIASLLVLLKLSFISISAVAVVFFIYTILREKKFTFNPILYITVPVFVVFLLSLLFYIKYPEGTYFNLIESNVLINREPLVWSIKKMSLYFLVPQNFLILIVILLSGFKYNMFEKLLLAIISVFIVTHLAAKILPEYLTSIFPLFCLLGAIRFNKFSNNLKRIRLFFARDIKKIFIVMYIFSMPFGLIYLKHIIQGSDYGLNPIDLYILNKKVALLHGNTVLSSWLGYYVYSDNKTIINEDYISSFIHFKVDDKIKQKYNIKSDSDYKNLIEDRTSDVIIYDRNNSTFLEQYESIINSNYLKAFEYKNIIVYKK